MTMKYYCENSILDEKQGPRIEGAAFFVDRVVLRFPITICLCMLAVLVFLGLQGRNFKLDASSETLVLQSDEDLRYSRLIGCRYGQREFLVLAFTPKSDLLSANT